MTGHDHGAWKARQGEIWRAWDGKPHPFTPQGDTPPGSLWCSECASGPDARAHAGQPAEGGPTAEEYLGLAMSWAGLVLEYAQTGPGWAHFDAWQKTTQPAEQQVTRRQLHGAEAVLAVRSLKHFGVPDEEIRGMIRGGGAT